MRGQSASNSSAEAAIQFSCPVCGADQSCTERLAGEAARCTACESVIRLPGPSATTMDYAPEHSPPPQRAMRGTLAITCPQCGSADTRATRRTSHVGWLMFGLGVVGACFTYGISLVLCVIGALLNDRLGKCRACGWTWLRA